MKYYVRHKFGVSTEHNTFEEHPWHGAGQGAANVALWYIALSDVLIDASHEQIQPTILHDPMLTLSVIQSIKAFIDDVAMSGSTPSNSYNELIQKAQNQLRWWNSLIKVTGGALNPAKCCSAIHLWQPDKLGILKKVQPNPNEPKVTLSDTNSMDTITILKPSEGTRYLGVYLAPDGSTKTMEQQLWKKAILYTTAFQRTHMS